MHLRRFCLKVRNDKRLCKVLHHVCPDDFTHWSFTDGTRCYPCRALQTEPVVGTG